LALKGTDNLIGGGGNLYTDVRFLAYDNRESGGRKQYLANKFFTDCRTLEELWLDDRLEAVATRKPDGAVYEINWSCGAVRCSCAGASVREPLTRERSSRGRLHIDALQMWPEELREQHPLQVGPAEALADGLTGQASRGSSEHDD